MRVEIERGLKKKKGNQSWKAYLTLPIISWALYDFANTIFSSNINTIFWPFYMQEIIGNNEVQEQLANTFIAYANSIASFLLVIFSPLFGVLIDRTGRKKKYIVIFTLLSVSFTILMGIFAEVNLTSTIMGVPLYLALVIVSFIIAKFFFHSSLVFYDTMIADLGKKEDVPLISGFGVAIGYLGTLLGLTVYLYVGNSDFHHAFIPTAILFLLFSLPLFFFIKDNPKKVQVENKASFLSGYKEIYKTFKEIKSHRVIFTFMIAYFFLNDALATTIAMMAPYASTIVGFSAGEFILLYLVSTVSSIIGSFIFGYITKSVGAYRAIRYVSLLLLVALIIGTFAVNAWMFWIAGSMFGIALGSMWVTSRTYIVDLTPEDKRGQFFGLFAFSGKVSSIIGPFIFGTITYLLASHGSIASRFGMGSLIVLTLVGLFFLNRIKPEEN